MIDGTPWVRQKLDAMRAHATQITEDGPFFAGTKVLGDAQWSHEYYQLRRGVPYPGPTAGPTTSSPGWTDSADDRPMPASPAPPRPCAT